MNFLSEIDRFNGLPKRRWQLALHQQQPVFQKAAPNFNSPANLTGYIA
jgi:hypothetical protein